MADLELMEIAGGHANFMTISIKARARRLFRLGDTDPAVDIELGEWAAEAMVRNRLKNNRESHYYYRMHRRLVQR